MGLQYTLISTTIKMGKGFNNFMSKKAFHPGSYQNQKRIHEAEARAEAKRKHDEETLAQYQKEQELFNQKSLVSKESKEKLSLNFMYDAPPGVEKATDKRGSEKAEWKGTSSSGIGQYKAIKTEPTTSIKCEATSGITLEWKRDRPVRNSAQAKRGQEVGDKGVAIKVEPKRETNTDDLKCRTQARFVETSRASSTRDSSARYPDMIATTAKRIKKEH